MIPETPEFGEIKNIRMPYEHRENLALIKTYLIGLMTLGCSHDTRSSIGRTHLAAPSTICRRREIMGLTMKTTVRTTGSVMVGTPTFYNEAH